MEKTDLKCKWINMSYAWEIKNYRISGNFESIEEESIFFEFSTYEIDKKTPHSYKWGFKIWDKICIVTNFFIKNNNKHESNIRWTTANIFLANKKNLLEYINKYSKIKYKTLTIE